ncbi:MAG: hypothetical protein OXL39_02910 [Caldilineaceae bacterium]|nr:hypothetical protein [Caldilineaceae bacterium]
MSYDYHDIGEANAIHEFGDENDRLRGRTTVERSQQLSDARQGDELLAVQVASECS